MASVTFRNAQAQSAEQVLTIEEIKMKAPSAGQEESAALLTVRFGTDSKEFDISDREKALEEIGEYFHVSRTCAESLLELAEEKISEAHTSDTDTMVHDILPEPPKNEAANPTPIDVPPIIPEHENPIPPPPSRGAR
jgi:hypothetical protein